MRPKPLIPILTVPLLDMIRERVAEGGRGVGRMRRECELGCDLANERKKRSTKRKRTTTKTHTQTKRHKNEHAKNRGAPGMPARPPQLHSPQASSSCTQERGRCMPSRDVTAQGKTEEERKEATGQGKAKQGRAEGGGGEVEVCGELAAGRSAGNDD